MDSISSTTYDAVLIVVWHAYINIASNATVLSKDCCSTWALLSRQCVPVDACDLRSLLVKLFSSLPHFNFHPVCKWSVLLPRALVSLR